MSLFGNIREASLSFVSDGKTYTLQRPWTNDDVFKLMDSPTYIRNMLPEGGYAKWRKTHKTRTELEKFTGDSFATISCTGDHVYGLLSALQDDRYFPLVEADLNARQIWIEDLLDGSVPIRRAVAIFASFTPTNSNFAREANKPHSEWSPGEYMLAELVDLMNFQVQLQHVTAQVGGWQPRGKTRPPKPIFLRPGEEREKPKMDKTEDLIALMKARRNGQG